MNSTEYTAWLDTNVRSADVDTIIWNTVRKSTISTRQKLAHLICSVPVGPASLVIPGTKAQLAVNGNNLRIGDILTDDKSLTEFEVILDMDPPDWKHAQDAIYNSLNVSQSIQNAARFEHKGEICSVNMTNAGEYFNQVQIDVLKNKGITLTKIEVDLEMIADSPMLISRHQQPQGEEQKPETPPRVQFREFL